MTDYKQAGDLVPDDLFIRRRRDRPRDQIFRVITTRPGNAATIVEVVVESNEDRQAQHEQFLPEQSSGDSAKGPWVRRITARPDSQRQSRWEIWWRRERTTQREVTIERMPLREARPRGNAMPQPPRRPLNYEPPSDPTRPAPRRLRRLPVLNHRHRRRAGPALGVSASAFGWA